MAGFVHRGHKGLLVMDGPAQIWAARSADTTARLTPASCVQATRPESLLAPSGHLLPHISRTQPAKNNPKHLALQRDLGGMPGGPQRSFCGLVSHSHPGDVCSMCKSQSGPSRLPSRNPPTNFLPARLKCFLVSLPFLLPFPLPGTLLPILSIRLIPTSS